MSECNNNETMSGVRQVRIGDVVIDPARRRVERTDGATELPQRPFDLLCLFLAEPRTLHTRKDLFRRIWKGVVVEDANLSQSVWVLRRALGEQGKEWIRTVAKGGYVFDPPLPIEVFDDTPVTAVASAPAVAPAAADVAPVAAPRPASTRRYRMGLAAAALALALVGGAWATWRVTHPREPLRVMLVDAAPADATGARTPLWPVQLLREWLEWKLSREPGVVVVSASQLADADQFGRIVLLSVSDSPGGSERLRLHAHIGDGDAPDDLIVDALPAEIPKAADRISTQVLQKLLPDGSEVAFPAFDIDADGARDFIVAMQRRDARRPAEAVAGFEAVLKREPTFWLARVELAEVLDELGQVGAAKQQMAFAEQWTSRLPPAALRIQQAHDAMLSRNYTAATDAYATLVRDYPYQPHLRIDLARASTLAQRSAAALVALDAIDWSTQPLPLRLDAMLARAEAQRESGALDAAKETAGAAAKLAADAGWSVERGRALLIHANASINDASTEKWAPFERAAAEFEAAGDRMNMLRARLGGEAMRPFDTDPDADGRLGALLGEARAAGNREIEVGALRLESRRYRRAADFVHARELLIEASAVAQAAGDVQRDAALQRDLALVSMGMLDLAAADRYLDELATTNPQGGLRLLAGQIAVRLENYRGRYDKALAVADAVTANPTEASTITAAMIDCDRSLPLFAQGDLAASQIAAERCMRSQLPYDLVAGNLAIAKVALASGDAAEALRRLEAIKPSLESLPNVDRWDLGAIALGLRVRAGEHHGIEAALEAIVAKVAPGQMRAAEAEARLNLAELALAHDDLPKADAQIAALEALVPEGVWSAQSRLALVVADREFLRGDAKKAQAQLVALDGQAQARGDVAVELLAHALAVNWGGNLCPATRDRELIARSGMRGLSEGWLLGDHLVPAHAHDGLALGRSRDEPPEGR